MGSGRDQRMSLRIRQGAEVPPTRELEVEAKGYDKDQVPLLHPVYPLGQQFGGSQEGGSLLPGRGWLKQANCKGQNQWSAIHQSQESSPGPLGERKEPRGAPEL